MTPSDQQTSWGSAGLALEVDTWPEETIPENPQVSYYRSRFYDQSAGRFLSEDPIKFGGGAKFYRFVGNDPIDSTDPCGLVQLCCRVARSVYCLGINGCHCFLKLSDGGTLGGYWKFSTYLLLGKRQTENDDRERYVKRILFWRDAV